MEATVTALLLWVSIVTGLPNHPPPDVFFETQEAMFETTGVEYVVGYYNNEEDIIVLHSEWDVNNPFDLSLLAHELVHYLQDQNNVQFPCNNAREVTAYEVQERFLKMWSIDINQYVDPLLRIVISSCLHM